MIHTYLKPQRPAIAMIELIFAIMVMGIVMTSVPQLLSVANNSSYAAIQQEGINEAATQANIMLGYEWDENNIIEGHDTVLKTNGDAGLNGTLTLPKRRAGTPAISHRLFISYDGKEFNATAIGYDVNETNITHIDDIDDFNGTGTILALDGGTATDKDYIEKGTVRLSRAVTYISDTQTGTGTYANGGTGILTFTPNFASVLNSTNIKGITVTLTSTSTASELNTKQITLYAFSCNIGSYALEEK